jgi:hypothetical protein
MELLSLKNVWLAMKIAKNALKQTHAQNVKTNQVQALSMQQNCWKMEHVRDKNVLKTLDHAQKGEKFAVTIHMVLSNAICEVRIVN